MTPPDLLPISVIVTCPNGCRAASSALRRVRSQLASNDELIVVESGECTDQGSGEIHLVSATQDDNRMTLEGIPHAHHEVVLVLEDHALIGPEFIATLRLWFANPLAKAATFYVENGTPTGIGSQALFRFMYGFATPQLETSNREMVAASFAIRRREMSEWLVGNPDPIRAGAVRTELIPSLIAKGPQDAPETLCLLHCQTVSVAQGTQAVFLNALRHGFLEKRTVVRRVAWSHAKQRYLRRPARLQAVASVDRRTALAIRVLAGSAWLGWWLGRVSRNVEIGRKMAELHPHN